MFFCFFLLLLTGKELVPGIDALVSFWSKVVVKCHLRIFFYFLWLFVQKYNLTENVRQLKNTKLYCLGYEAVA